jgi:hypothetical protein
LGYDHDLVPHKELGQAKPIGIGATIQGSDQGVELESRLAPRERTSCRRSLIPGKVGPFSQVLLAGLDTATSQFVDQFGKGSDGRLVALGI